jgi:hypothetical protein
MNYNSVILVGVVALTGLWWLVNAAEHYPGPRLMHLYISDVGNNETTLVGQDPGVEPKIKAETAVTADDVGIVQ